MRPLIFFRVARPARFLSLCGAYSLLPTLGRGSSSQKIKFESLRRCSEGSCKGSGMGIPYVCKRCSRSSSDASPLKRKLSLQFKSLPRPLGLYKSCVSGSESEAGPLPFLKRRGLKRGYGRASLTFWSKPLYPQVTYAAQGLR
jgi:hypothetical protein